MLDLFLTEILCCFKRIFIIEDDHCRKLVQEGVVEKLLSVLKDCDENLITLQHALLSALRNLAIPGNV